jgi:hypothetical protein
MVSRRREEVKKQSRSRDADASEEVNQNIPALAARFAAPQDEQYGA